MLVHLFNCDDILAKHLSGSFEISSETRDDYSGCFIDWIPTFKKVQPPVEDEIKRLIKQTELIEYYTKKKTPVIIFDRFLGLTQKEIQWFKKFRNVHLFEPSIRNRQGIRYMPFWAEIKRFDDIDINEAKRECSLYYKGNILERLQSFEKYMKEYANAHPENKTCWNGTINLLKENEYEKTELKYSPLEFYESKTFLALGTPKDYNIGYLDPLVFKALENNCIPLVPKEHRYYNTFHTIIENIEDINYYVNTYDLTYIGHISDFYKVVETYYPEMMVENVVETIKTIFKKREGGINYENGKM